MSLRDRTAMSFYCFPTFSKTKLHGKGAKSIIDRQTNNKVPKPAVSGTFWKQNSNYNADTIMRKLIAKN